MRGVNVLLLHVMMAFHRQLSLCLREDTRTVGVEAISPSALLHIPGYLATRYKSSAAADSWTFALPATEAKKQYRQPMASPLTVGSKKIGCAITCQQNTAVYWSIPYCKYSTDRWYKLSATPQAQASVNALPPAAKLCWGDVPWSWDKRPRPRATEHREVLRFLRGWAKQSFPRLFARRGNRDQARRMSG